MSVCEDIRTDLGGYVLGALEPPEAAAVRAHLEHCPQCAREHASLQRLPALLDLAQGLDAAAAPPPAVEERLLDRVARTPRESSGPRRARPRFPRLPSRRRRPLGLAAVGLACAALGAGIAALALNGNDERVPAAPRYQVALTGTPAMPRAHARAALESVPGGTTVLMWVRGLPRDSDTVYEVRCEKGDWGASAGTFRVNRDGRAYVALTTAARRGEYDRIRVVRRHYDESKHRSTSTSVMTGKLS